MLSKNTKLFSGIFFITALLGLLLFREIEMARKITTEAEKEPLIADQPTAITIGRNDQILGNPGAPITIVEYIDLGSKNGRNIHYELSSFVKKSPSEIRLIFKHSPAYRWFWGSEQAHIATYCAGKQNKLWVFIDSVILNDFNLRESGLKLAAEKVKLDVEKWEACKDSEEAKLAVQKDVNEAKGFELGKPPLVFLNNKKLKVTRDISLTQLLTTLTEK